MCTVAITMPRIRELLLQLKGDYPDIRFVRGENFKWSASKKELSIADDEGSELYVLHELAHALLGHADFTLDIELLRQEREAWDLVRNVLGPRYGIANNDDIIEDALDTYRQWLHERTLCPACGLSGFQTKTSTYVCVNCRCSWRSNDARRVNLRRYRLT